MTVSYGLSLMVSAERFPHVMSMIDTGLAMR